MVHKQILTVTVTLASVNALTVDSVNVGTTAPIQANVITLHTI